MEKGSEEDILGLHEVSSLVSKFCITEKLKSAQDHFDWNALKHTPQKLKQKAKLGSYLVDEVFDELETQLLVFEGSLRKLEKSIIQYKDYTFEVCKRTSTVTNSATSLFDPNSGLSRKVRLQLNLKNHSSIDGNLSSVSQLSLSSTEKQSFSNEYNKWENTKIFLKVSGIILATIKDEVERLGSTLTSRIEMVLTLIQNIKKHIKKRSYAKYEYDRMYNKHEALLLKLKQSELSVKQSPQIHNLERKVEDHKKEYDYINGNLKKELPYFFKLVISFLDPVYLMIFFTQLIVDYQFSSNILCLKDYFSINEDELTSESYLNNLVKQHSSDIAHAANSLDNMFITNFRKQYFDSLTTGKSDEVNTSKSEYCIAQFSFQALQIGDLSIKVGDVIKIIDGSSSWWKGQLNGKEGYFPSNYVSTTSKT